MTDTDMFPFDPSNIMGSEGLKAEARAAERKAAHLHHQDEDEESGDDATEPYEAPVRPAAPRRKDEPEAVLGESWDDARVRLRGHFPDTKEGILFCVYKLLQDREANFRDFRDEAMTRGVGLSGRSLHSAKVLLGMAEPSKRKPNQRAVEIDDEDDEVEAPRAPAPRSPAPRTEFARAGAPRTGTPTRTASRHNPASASATPSVEGALRQAIAQIEEAAQAENARLKDAIRDAIELLQAALDD